jgi:TnpA family transposase
VGVHVDVEGGFYRKDSELSGEDREDQEISMLAVHLLQSSLVLVDTLIIQQILSEPGATPIRPVTSFGPRPRARG